MLAFLIKRAVDWNRHQAVTRPLTGPGSLWNPLHDRFLIAYQEESSANLARILDRSATAIKSRLRKLEQSQLRVLSGDTDRELDEYFWTLAKYNS